MGLSSYAISWLDNPDGGQIYTQQRDLLKSHDSDCSGLQHPWLPRKGGRSCPSDLELCDCGIYFFNEGCTSFAPGCDWHWFCSCCAAKMTTCPRCGDDDGS